jgi:hypothetical protein
MAHNTEQYDPASAAIYRQATNDTILRIPYPERGQVSDGYHTFDELYEHRCLLWLRLAGAIARLSPDEELVWFTLEHSDGSVWDGWFLLGIGYHPGEQMTYHLPMSLWGMVEAVPGILLLERAPAFDGHTSRDVLERLKTSPLLSFPAATQP